MHRHTARFRIIQRSKDMDNGIKIICNQCGAELLPDKENRIYRCTHCGVAYGSSVLFDRNAAAKARKSLEMGEFNDADVWYNCILMTCSYDFEALRGRVLCAGKWKSFNDVEDPTPLSTVRINNVRERAAEGKIRAWEKDQEYFSLCIKLINKFELLWKKETEIKPLAKKWESYKGFSDFLAEYNSLERSYGYTASVSTTRDIDRKLKPLMEERDKIKKSLLKVRQEIIDFENNRGITQ